MFHYIFILTIITLSSAKQYRPDYEYNRKTDSFYKLHVETYNRLISGKVCEAEGATLMVVNSDYDIAQVHGMLKNYPDIGEYVYVNEDNSAHEAVEEQPIINMEDDVKETPWNERCEVVTRNGEVKTLACQRELPFICKVEAKDAYFDETCGVFGKNYVFKSGVGSCYRVSNIAYSWNGAYAECSAEGAHLVVLNSVTEHEVVWNMIKKTRGAMKAKASWFFFAGFRTNNTTGVTPRVFRTIFNQTLEEAGYNQWAENEPNNFKNNENCGSIFKNDGKFNDLCCSRLYPFICETEIHK